MNSKQLLVSEFIQNKHNLVILGQAGTGKTFTITNVLNKFKDDKRKSVVLTCYTGIACRQYRGSPFTATTLHRFAGLEDGRHDVTKLVNLLMSDERYQKTKYRIMNTDILIIDEVSMVSKKILESVEYLCRKLRNQNKIFGGIQVVLCGDFYQLPPIKDELYGDSGLFCFEAYFFNNFFKHIIVLNEVYRQDEDSLINAVNELEKGVPSERTNEFLKTLSRPLNVPSTEVIKLFARNIDADICNYNILNELPGEIFTFDSQDFGDTYFLRKFIAPKHLGLKINAKVMLLTNLTDEYVNGLVGTIVNINHKCIEVNFDGKIVKITRILFTKYDPVTSVILSQRYQFPLRLAYAVTIHKSQGMTIPFVEIDCKNAYSPGQLGVAVGRAVSTTGLRVLNYNQNIVKKHPDKINLFYKSIDSSTLVTDLSDNICCSSLVSTTELTESDMKGGSESETIKGTQSTSLPIHSDSSDSESEELLNILSSFHEEHNYYASSSHVSENMVRAFEIAIQDYIGTSEEVPVRQACALLLKSDQCVSWYKVQHEKVRVMFETSFTAEPGKNQPCHLSNFYASFNKYICSTEYLQEMEQFSNIHYGHEILTSVMFAIQAYRMEHKSHLVNFEKVDVNVFPKQQCPPGNDGKLRYIAGYTIAKCRYRLCSALRNRLFVPGMEIEINQLNEKIKILDTCIVSGTDIVKETKYPKSLEEIHRKQNEREGLTNVTDRTFEFFCKLQQTAVILMSFESLKSQRKYLFRYVYNNVVKNTTVLESFEKNFAVSFVHVNSTYYEKDKHCIQELLESMSAFCSHVVTLFEMIVKLFITVMFSQFRKDYLRVVKREKGKALRKKIMEKNEKNAFQHVTMDFIRNDMSTDKTISHLKLKTDALSDPLFYKNFKKAELLQLLKCYNESISSGSSKNDIGEYLTDILTNPECVKMCNPTCLQEQYTENTNNLEKLKTRTTVNNEQPHSSKALSAVEKKIATTFAKSEKQCSPKKRCLTKRQRSTVEKSEDQHSPILICLPKRQKTVVKSEERRCPSPKSSCSPKQQTRTVVKSEDQHCPSPKSTSLPKQQTKSVVKSEDQHCPSPKSTSLPKQQTKTVVKSEDQHCPSPKSTCLRKRQTRTFIKSEEQHTQKQNNVRKRVTKSRKGKKCSSEEITVSQCKRKNLKKGKNKGKARKIQSEEDNETDGCCVCNKFYREGEDWICCDLCSHWYHRHCVNLIDEEEWDYFSSEDAIYTCPLCQ